jgi:hypothetical protein
MHRIEIPSTLTANLRYDYDGDGEPTGAYVQLSFGSVAIGTYPVSKSQFERLEYCYSVSETEAEIEEETVALMLSRLFNGFLAGFESYLEG